MCFPSVQEVGQGFECSILRNEMAEDSEKKEGRSCAKFWLVSSPERGVEPMWMRQRRKIVGGTSILRCRDVLRLGNNGVDGCGSSHDAILFSLFVISVPWIRFSTRASLVVTLMSRAIYLKIDIISIITSPPAFTSFWPSSTYSTYVLLVKSIRMYS